MFRLVITSCLLVGATLAKPSPRAIPKAAARPAYAAHAALARGDPEPVNFGDGPQPLSARNGFSRWLQPVDFQVTPLPQQPDNNLAAGNYQWTSPNYGTGNYPNNYDFSTKITGKEGQKISISCSPFNLEAARRCGYDYLSVNGAKYCGSGQITTISSTELAIQFHTDYSVTASGFSCSIEVPSGGSGGSGGCQCGVRQTGRIVGGSNATAGQFSWQAGLVQPGGTRTFCGGSVINNRYVLTARHCTVGSTASQIQVLLGDLNIGTADAGEQRFSVEQIINHPDYTSASVSGWDFSLLKLDREITFSSTIFPVCLPEAGQSYAGATAIASGYGRVGAEDPQATILQHVQLPVWTHSSCEAKWQPNIIKSNMICAGGSAEGGKSVCMGDSGGPLVTEVSGRFRLIGVVSFGEPCAVAGSPDVFARVTEALSWIASNTADAQYCSA